MSISVHVVDCTHGRAAAHVAVRLSVDRGGVWQEQARGRTDASGRAGAWQSQVGLHQIECDLDGYFAGLGVVPFYPSVSVVFRVSDVNAAYRIPLLITPHGYGTFREWQSAPADGLADWRL